MAAYPPRPAKPQPPAPAMSSPEPKRARPRSATPQTLPRRPATPPLEAVLADVEGYRSLHAHLGARVAEADAALRSALIAREMQDTVGRRATAGSMGQYACRRESWAFEPVDRCSPAHPAFPPPTVSRVRCLVDDCWYAAEGDTLEHYSGSWRLRGTHSVFLCDDCFDRPEKARAVLDHIRRNAAALTTSSAADTAEDSDDDD